MPLRMYLAGGCSHHTNQARIYLKMDTKSPGGLLYFNSAQFHLNGFATFDSTYTKESLKFQSRKSLTSSRDGLSLTDIKGDRRLEHEKNVTDFAVKYVVAKR